MSESFETPWTVAYQAPLSVGFSRQEYGSRLPFSPPGDLPDPGIEPASPVLTGGLFTTEAPRKQPLNFATQVSAWHVSFLSWPTTFLVVVLEKLL